MRFARLTGALAIAFAVVLTAFGPGAIGPVRSAAAAPNGPVVLVDTNAADPAPFVAAGGKILEDYGNGLLLVRIPSSLAGAVGGLRGVHPIPDRTLVDVYFSGIRFDTAIGEPAFPAALNARVGGSYLLQFAGPIRSEWVSELERHGLAVDAYLANFAFVVQGPPAAIRAARTLPYVNWIGPYHPGYKVAAALLARSGDVRVSVIGFESASPESLGNRVAELGGRVEQLAHGPPSVVAKVPSGRLAALAGQPEVLAIQEYRPPIPMDRIAGQIHKYHNAWDTKRSGLATTLTGRSPGPDGIPYNADDQFEGAGLEDTGLDEGDPNDGALDFFDSPNGDRVIRFIDHTGASAPDGKCGTAHGTHVAGIIASDGYSWESYLNVGDPTVSVIDKEWHKSEAGVAPEAKLSVDGVQAGNALFCGTGVVPNPSYWDCQYLNGYITVAITGGVSAATCGQPWIDGSNVGTHNTQIDVGSRSFVVVHSNSWGSGSPTYGATANAADTRTNAAPERLVVFAAGNGGPDLNTVSGEGLLKNGLSVGAGQNYRPEQFESDNPNVVAGFSSRGGPGQSGGRIKPDLTAIGTSVVSLFSRGETLSTGFTPGADLITAVDKYCSLPKAFCAGGDGIADYRYLQGTSMATPHAAGMALLVREYLREVVAGNNPASPYYNPPAHLVKAILISGAVRMDPLLYEYPGYDQGWGRIDLEQSLFPPVPRTNQFALGEFTTTGMWTPSGMNLNVAKGDMPLKVTLVWLDAPGDALARNLDLRVRSPSGAEYHGNQYTSGWSDPLKAGFDTVNNVEQVEVQAPEAGAWTVEVVGVSIPSAAKFALVFSADVGPVATYKVDLSTTYPTAVALAPLGSATIPLTALNYGTVTDTVQLSSTAPAGLTVTYLPANALPLASRGSQDALALITASVITPGIYEFDLRAVSADDPSPTPASDFIPVRVEVLSSPLPFPIQVTNSTVDELDPSVLAFDDAAVGRHLFIAYRKTSKVSQDGRTGGVNVWVGHTTIDANGQPVQPFDQVQVSNLNEAPNDLRLLRVHAGTLKNRVLVTWTGTDPDEANPDAVSWSRIGWLDPPYTGTWQFPSPTPYIQKNEGSAQPCNIARVSFPLFRAATGGMGQLIYVWETLGFTGGCTTLSVVATNAKTSTDGGATWSARTQVFPPPGNNNFYFFPNGVVDQNDVAWVFVYWRTPTGNDRDLTVRLLDNAGWSAFPRADYTILDTTDNVQWPAALSTAEGPGNRVYVTFTRDNLQADLKMYLLYAQGTYSSTIIPKDFRDPGAGPCGPGCTASADFSPPAGSGLKGPFGTSVSNANFNRRPILNIVRTTDGTIWLPHLENANPYRTPNLYTYYSADGFATNPPVTILTADAFAKGHQMSSALTVGGQSRVYEVYHSSRGTVTQVNYEVYLLIYFVGWPAAADTRGPLATSVGGTPNPVNKSATFRLTANLNDITTGNGLIAGAEYSIDTLAAPGSGTGMAATDGAFNSPTEAVDATINVAGLGWSDNQCHVVYVRGRDAAGNWGPAASVLECTEAGNVDTTPPAPPILAKAELGLVGPTFADVVLTWNQASDEGASGGTTKYRVFRATDLGGAFVQVKEIAATGASSYSWTDVGAGDGNPNIYLYRVRSVDAAGNEALASGQAAKFSRSVTAGWNLVSVPLFLADPSISKALQTVTPNWNRARTFVASDTADPWKTYIVGRANQEFTTVDPTRALWVNVLAADTFTVAGLVPTGQTITLRAGWNFVGFPSMRSVPYTVGDLKTAIPSVTAVEGWFDSLGPYYLRRLADTENFHPGFGYWMYATATATWTVP